MGYLRQLFTYSGSKFTLGVVFALYFATHRRFVSLFGGSAGEFACKMASPVEIYNDLDDHLYTVWRVLQSPKHYQRLQRLVQNTPNGRKQFELCCRILHDPPSKHSAVRRAWAFLIVGNTCRGGIHPAISRSWTTACDTTDKATRNVGTLPQRLEHWKERFRHVRIEHADWYDVFIKYDRDDTQFFLDPPYFPLTLRSSCRLYQHELATEMHVKLLQTISGAKGYVMLCGYNHPAYTLQLFHWRKMEFPVKAHMGGKGTPRREIIWMNYFPDGTKIGGNKLLIAKRYLEMLGNAETAQKYLDRISTLMSFGSPQDTKPLPQPAWLDYANDGRSLTTTKLLIAKRYIELLGSPVAAQKYLGRIVTLGSFPQ